MKSVYSAVRTGSLNRAVCASSFRTNSDLFHLQHKLTGFYSRDEKCLQRGTVWVFKLSIGFYNPDEKCLQRGTDWVFKLSIGFHNRDEKCLQRGTDWVFKYSSLLLVFKELILKIFLHTGDVRVHIH